jgi:hypothetical protein
MSVARQCLANMDPGCWWALSVASLIVIYVFVSLLAAVWALWRA